MKTYLIAAASLFFVLSSGLRSAHAEMKLKDVCGPEGTSKMVGDDQLATLCRSAYVNGNSWIINDNNSRVRASVAVTCAYTCLAGGLGSCSGNAGGACSSAVDSGHKAYDYRNASSDNYTAAQHNGGNAFGIQGQVSQIIPDGSTSSSAAVGAGGLPPACKAAITTGSVQDRIACAVATDPTLPPSATDPRFQAEFEKASGMPLQQAINGSTDSLMQSQIPSGIQHAIGQLGDSAKAADFVAKGVGLINTLLGTLPTAGDKSYLLSNILPKGLSKFFPGVVYDPKAKRPGAAAPDAPGAADGPKLAFAQPDGEAPAGAPPGITQDSSPAADPVAKSSDDIFKRVSARYQDQLTRGQVEALDWSLPMNQAMATH